jgi:hypothetical protein
LLLCLRDESEAGRILKGLYTVGMLYCGYHILAWKAKTPGKKIDKNMRAPWDVGKKTGTFKNITCSRYTVSMYGIITIIPLYY